MPEQSVAPAAGGASAFVASAPPTSEQQSGHRPRYAAFLGFKPVWERRIALFIILVQAFWAIAIPIKNVIMISNPVFRPDSVDTETSTYRFLPSESAPVVIPGKDIVPLLQKVLDIVISQRMIRGNFESVGSFDLDTAYQLLSPEDFHTISQYYALFFQATEFPGGAMTPRPQYFAGSNDALPQDALGVWIRPTDPSQSDWFLRLSCSAENTKLDGTRCFQGNTSNVCFDFPKKGEVRRYESASLDNLRGNTGMANNIGLLYLIEVFHSTMAALFSNKSWKKTLASIQFVTNADDALNNALSSVYSDDGRPLMLEKHAASFCVPLDLIQTKNLESCAISASIASKFYTKAFVLKLIQSALTAHDVYDPNESIVQLPNQTDAIVSSILAFDLVLTSGARYGPMSDAGSRRFAGVMLATVNTASMRLKLDKKLNGEQVFGSSIRMIEYMAYYPEYYSYMQRELRQHESGASYDQINYSILGSGTSGLFTFKGNWWGNTMEVYRLRELPGDPEMTKTNTTAVRMDSWWDDEAKFALWFEELEQTPQAPFYMFNKYIDIAPHQVVLNDNPVTACHRAFFKTLTKVAFLSLLALSDLPSYLIFMSNVNGGANAWFKTTVHKTELHGETIDGSRYAFSYTPDAVTRRNDGSAWVAVPLLHAMLQYFNRSEALQMLTVEFNRSFASLVATEYGLLHFSDMAQCKIGFVKNNVTDEDNTVEKIMDKLYPSVVSFFVDLLDATPALHSSMKVDLENAADAVQMVEIREEMLKGSPSGLAASPSMGSPVFWTPTAFSVGMLKFWPAATPPSTIVKAYRNATTCYATLELRYLNASVRCWVEPNNAQKTRVEHKSILMGKIMFSIWSTSLVLNLIASFIATGFIWRLVTAWRITKFRCVNIWVALQLNFQGFGVLSFSQILLLALSTTPLMLGYHIPVDNVFIMDQDVQHFPKWFKDVVVTLSASWFYRLGFETANQFVVLHQVSFWFSNFRLRVLCMLFIFILRIATPDKMHSAEYETTKLLFTCCLSTLMGVASVLLPVCRQRRHPSTAIQPMATKSQNLVIASINKHGMPLNKYGLVGYSRRGWSLAGLIVEGWEVVKHKGKNQYVAVKGMCRIPLAADESGDINSLL